MKTANKIKHWKDALATSKEIKWKRPPIKNIEDGKLDIIITVPLTELFEAQTKRAFGYGMLAMLDFNVHRSEDKKPIEIDELINLFNGFGLPEIAQQLFRKQGTQ